MEQIKTQFPEEMSVEDILKSIKGILSDGNKEEKKENILENDDVFVLTKEMQVNQDPLFSKEVLSDSLQNKQEKSLLSSKVQWQVEKSVKKLQKITKEQNKIDFPDEKIQRELTPLLKKWLDNNLPEIVERIVEKEVRFLLRKN